MLRECIYVSLRVLLRALFLVLFFCPVLIIVVIVDIPYSACITAIFIFFIVSLTGPIIRSRSLATANSELNNTSKEAASRSRMPLVEQPDIAAKLAELLKAVETVETSITKSEQNKDSRAKAHGIRKQNDLLKSKQEQHAQIATLISQSALQTRPAIHPTPFYGKPTDDLLSLITHFERLSNFCNWDDHQHVGALPLYLQGNASSGYASFDPQTFKSYSDLVDALKAHFSNSASV